LFTLKPLRIATKAVRNRHCFQWRSVGKIRRSIGGQLSSSFKLFIDRITFVIMYNNWALRLETCQQLRIVRNTVIVQLFLQPNDRPNDRPVEHQFYKRTEINIFAVCLTIISVFLLISVFLRHRYGLKML